MGRRLWGTFLVVLQSCFFRSAVANFACDTHADSRLACSDRGVCVVHYGEGRRTGAGIGSSCLCDAHMSGTLCQIHPCDSKRCGLGASCRINSLGTPYCACGEGWVLSDHNSQRCVLCPGGEHPENTCGGINAGSCISDRRIVESSTCACNDGFTQSGVRGICVPNNIEAAHADGEHVDTLRRKAASNEAGDDKDKKNGDESDSDDSYYSEDSSSDDAGDNDSDDDDDDDDGNDQIELNKAVKGSCSDGYVKSLRGNGCLECPKICSGQGGNPGTSCVDGGTGFAECSCDAGYVQSAVDQTCYKCPGAAGGEQCGGVIAGTCAVDGAGSATCICNGGYKRNENGWCEPAYYILQDLHTITSVTSSLDSTFGVAFYLRTEFPYILKSVRLVVHVEDKEGVALEPQRINPYSSYGALSVSTPVCTSDGVSCQQSVMSPLPVFTSDCNWTWTLALVGTLSCHKSLSRSDERCKKVAVDDRYGEMSLPDPIPSDTRWIDYNPEGEFVVGFLQSTPLLCSEEQIFTPGGTLQISSESEIMYSSMLPGSKLSLEFKLETSIPDFDDYGYAFSDCIMTCSINGQKKELDCFDSTLASSAPRDTLFSSFPEGIISFELTMPMLEGPPGSASICIITAGASLSNSHQGQRRQLGRGHHLRGSSSFLTPGSPTGRRTMRTPFSDSTDEAMGNQFLSSVGVTLLPGFEVSDLVSSVTTSSSRGSQNTFDSSRSPWSLCSYSNHSVLSIAIVILIALLVLAFLLCGRKETLCYHQQQHHTLSFSIARESS
jgi:hypothetical protein